MTPIHWALLPFKRYSEFSGRSPRAEYWWYVLAVVIVGAIIGFIDGFIFHGPIYGSLGPFSLLFVAGTAVPGTAVLVRRLHDTDRSGWWALIRLPEFLIIASGSNYGAVGVAVGQTSGPLFVAEIVAVVAFLCVGLFLFVCAVSEGDGGPNRYGPDPYGPDQLEEVFA